jgi:hypothetical protein
MGTIDKNPILESIEHLCKNATPKVSFSKMCVDLGLSKSLNTKLKSNPSKTINGETAQKIADYFGVSVDRVLGSEQKEKPLTAAGEGLDVETIQLKEIWDSADQEERKALLAMAEMLKARRNK